MKGSLKELWDEVKARYYGPNSRRYIPRLSEAQVLNNMIEEFLEELDRLTVQDECSSTLIENRFSGGGQ